MDKATWKIAPCRPDQLRTLVDELGISATLGSVLVRRGLTDPAEAKRFLEGALPGHDPLGLGDMPEAVERIRAAIAAGKRICVHGDYDADGICATALAVFLLRELGADPAWHLPSRFEEGYGLAAQTIARLAEDGVGLVLTVDCGITAVFEVEEAARLGLEVVVTDHHRPGDTFPACPVVAPLKGDYAFTGLCGTAVVWKLAEALLGAGHPFLERHLDVVALATVADVVPLLDENRALALLGLRRLAQTQKPGLRALMRVAGVDPAACDEGAIGFRLAPRINAAGRLGRPEAALALLLTDDANEAKQLAEQLEDLNRERQAVEDRILRAATAEIESWPEARRHRRGFVVAGEDWHEGVIGIVASRLVERYGRPVVLIAGSSSGGDWKGSGRAGSVFDLHGALVACGEHLERFGGHRAAAGLSIKPENVEAFAKAFGEHADGELTDEDLRPRVTIDAIVRGAELGLPLCEELAQLAPFGLSATPASRSSSTTASSIGSTPSAKGSTSASGYATAAATQAPRSRSGSVPRSTATAASTTTTSPSGSRRTAGTERSRPSSSCAGSSTPTSATTSSACGSPPNGAGASRPGPPRCARSSTSSASARRQRGPRRSLLESEAFRRLLEEPPLAEAA